ncbi:hypothetical protein CCR83_03275 [Rhodobacter veldkampii DSM 11550]|uniref:Phytoene synthase n=1 Tax=Phaeovulum veldkampii DSM 11550 TaxID=1185920 RepID=A0A2T4JMU5_9RHOB|nr:squalene/phytoene synthase family protein [Phaeovulum veldkampii]MBK5945495.1 hypothetical protein [Phaeovulum veldkampii DSM 11550]PTE19239.1 phytoene synthase [Phaeovulum veldkampii DSM 11550]TDQ62282.1 squalene/phytoene synthase [Phaeovulum veldkampii DSM 11550]
MQSLADAVATGDPDRFAATMAAPPAARARLWPLYALNLELARAPWASTQPMLAEMRLQWWIDALAPPVANTPPANTPEVLRAVADLMAETGLPVALLTGIAEARRRDCWDEPFADDAALWAYLEATSGNLMWAAARVLGAPEAAAPVVRDHAAAAGLANWLLALPELVRRGRAVMPEVAALRALAQTGLARHARAAAARPAVPKVAAPALYTGWQARAILAQAAADPGLVAAGGLGQSEFARRAGLVRLALTGRW